MIPPQTILLILLAGGMLLVIAAATHFSGQGSLDNIKSKTVGDGQHGTARWATKKEIQQTYQHIPKFCLGIEVFFLLRHLHHIAQRTHGTGNNGNFLYRLGVFL